MSPSRYFGMNCQGFIAVRLTLPEYADGRKREKFALLLQDVFDWLNPLSLGTMSASAYIENVASNPTCLIN